MNLFSHILQTLHACSGNISFSASSHAGTVNDDEQEDYAYTTELEEGITLLENRRQTLGSARNEAVLQTDNEVVLAVHVVTESQTRGAVHAHTLLYL